jgi:capsular exopolysaccharide synthesis family protein
MQKDKKALFEMFPQEPGLPSTRTYPRGFDYFVYPESEERSKVNLWHYWSVIVRRKWWALGFFLGVVSLAALITFSITPVYRAITLIQITSDNPGGVLQENEPGIGSLIAFEGRKEFSQTQFQILQSRSLAERVIKTLGLEKDQEFKVDPKRVEGHSQRLADEIMVENFQKRLAISPTKDTYLVKVSFEAIKPSLAKQVANTLVQEYVRFGMETRSKAYTTVQEWLDHQLEKLRSKIEASEKQLYSFSEASNIMDPEGQSNVTIQKYADLSGLLTKAESERMAKEAIYRQIAEKGKDSPVIINNPLTISLRQELASQEAKVASIRKIYLPGHPEMKVEVGKLTELRSRLNGEVDRLVKSAKADHEAAKRTEEMLSKSLNEQKGRVETLNKAAVKYKILKRDVQTNEELYKGLLARMKEASVTSTMVPTNVQVIDPAREPLFPSWPNKKLNFLLASILGAFGGIGLAFLVDYFDSSVKSKDEWERVSQIPVLGSVPSLTEDSHLPVLPESQQASLIFIQQPQSQVSEAIRHLRTSVLSLSDNGGPSKVILVTSPNPGEGKTTVSVNLACSLASQDSKVVLIDGDMRRPQISKLFHKSSQPGLSDFLNNSVEADQIIKPTEVPNLAIITAGTIPANPTELLGLNNFREFIRQLRRDFNHVVLDSPPILGFADGLVLSTMVDGVLLVIKHLYTPSQAGRLACEILQKINAPLIGTVMNYVNSFAAHDFQHYYYKNYYSNYYAPKDQNKPQ